MLKSVTKKILHNLGYDIKRISSDFSIYSELFTKYEDFTMVPKSLFIANLALVNQFKNLEGAIVECGVWRGGMIAAVAELLGNDRKYFLYDSFEGLPLAKEIDGHAAKVWQNDTASPWYHDNCTAERSYAEKAMYLSGASDYYIHEGWFHETLPNFKLKDKIAVLRLDGDWYESTMECLQCLYPSVIEGGLIIIDDYYTWDGCSKAVHDYVSKHMLVDRIYQYNNSIGYIIKR